MKDFNKITQTSSKDFLKKIGLPSLLNQNIFLPLDVDNENKYLRNKVTIDKIKSDEIKMNKL